MEIVLIYVLFSVVVIGLAVRAAIRSTRRRRDRSLERQVVDARYDEEIARRWDDLCRQEAATAGADLVEIVEVYQRARRGSKAIIRWLATGRHQDTWFEGAWPSASSVALVRGSTGWGPHNNNPETFYVRTHQILTTLPAGALAAVARHRRRWNGG